MSFRVNFDYNNFILGIQDQHDNSSVLTTNQNQQLDTWTDNFVVGAATSLRREGSVGGEDPVGPDDDQ